MIKTLCIVQARLTSSRLPNKVLMELGDSQMTILEHVYSRLKYASCVDEVVFAIPANDLNKRLENFLEERHIPYYLYTGDENDVLARYYHCAKTYNPKYIFRATCDNPCVDWKELELLFEHRHEGDYMVMDGAPLGVGVEFFSMSSLEKAYKEAMDSVEHEHVTPYIYRHPELFKILRIPYYIQAPNCRLTIDTPQDFQVVDTIYRVLYEGTPISNIEIYKYIESHQDICNINKDVHQVKV